MPRIGAHAFVWIPEWTTESGNDVIREAARLGFDFLEIPLLEPEKFDVASHRQVIDEVGIDIVASLVLPKDAHMPDRPDAAKAFLISALDALVAMGGNYLCGCIGYSLGTLTGSPPTEAERQTVVETLFEVCLEAEARGVSLALECCNRYETYLYNVLVDGQAAVKQIRAMGASNIELHGDTYHMNIEEEGFYKAITDCADTLGYMHLSESHRGLVGSGTVDWGEIFRGLAAINYTGPLVLESFANINPALAAATCLWRPPNRPPEVLATEGLAFLRAEAAKAGLA